MELLSGLRVVEGSAFVAALRAELDALDAASA